MVIRRRFAAPAALAILAACRAPAPPAAIDPALSARVPASTVALAGIHLDRLRASPLYAKLPPAAIAFLAPFTHAREVLVAYTGVELLTIARGVVPGATQVASDLALSGAPGLVAAATAAHPPAPILAPAASVAAGTPVWIVIRGGIAFPLEGNLANLNNLLRDSEFVTLTLAPGDPVELRLEAQCPAAQTALHFEQSFRALVSLTAANVRQPAVSALLASVDIRRQDRVVRVELSAPLDAFVKLITPN